LITQELFEAKLYAFGLHLRGCVRLSDAEVESLGSIAEPGASVALVGNVGSSYWPVFEQSREYLDGQAHPLDRWSRRLGEKLAGELDAQAIYPFEGPPFYPFQQWAKRAESLQQSMMGLMIHPEYGLWHSYRFGLVMSASQGLVSQVVTAKTTPCKSCALRPCLNTCPVGAFGETGYDVNTCAAYLKSTPEAACHTEGCMARSACPVGAWYRYHVEEHSFHLKAFLRSR
jgi:hypothetical protein